MSCENRVADERAALAALRATVRFHRGETVYHVLRRQWAQVDGWKGDLVLVLWGRANDRDYREWVRSEDLIRPAAVELLTAR